MNDGKNQSKISQGLGTNNYIIDILPALAYTHYYI